MAGPSDTSCSCTHTHMRIAYVIRSFFVPSPKTKWPCRRGSSWTTPPRTGATRSRAPARSPPTTRSRALLAGAGIGGRLVLRALPLGQALSLPLRATYRAGRVIDVLAREQPVSRAQLALPF